MSHDAHHGGHHESPKTSKRVCHGPGDCYGMPEKRFWRIVFVVASLTLVIVVSTVILVET
jgi:hypothetical protein